MLGDEVVIGSRDADRASEIAAVLGVEGATNEEAVRNADLVILAVRSNAALETRARSRRRDRRRRRVLSVASELEFTDDGIVPGLARARWPSGSSGSSTRAGRRGPAVARRRRPHQPRAAGRGRPRLRGPLRREGARARARRPPRERPCHRRRPARERPRARGDDGGDREREQALQGARGHPPLRAAVTGDIRVIPLAGIPEIEEGDDLGALIAERTELESGDVLVVAQKAVSKAEGRVVALDEIEPSERGARARRRRRPAPRRGDPPRDRPRRPQPAAARHRRDAARLRLRLGRRRRLERTGRGHRRPAPRRPRRLGHPAVRAADPGARGAPRSA